MSEKLTGMRIDSDGKKWSLIVYVENGGAAELDFEEGMPASVATEKLRALANRLDWLITSKRETKP